MGIAFSNPFKVLKLLKLFSKKEVRILMIGLDASGKTTILYKLKLGDNLNTIPTIGFNVETVNYKNISFTVWDVGGQEKLRPLWRHYYQNTNGIIFAVDSNDHDRVNESRDELMRMLEEDELRGVPLLILANKQDMKFALPVATIINLMKLGEIRNRPWHVQATNALTGDGLYEGLDWMTEALDKTMA